MSTWTPGHGTLRNAGGQQPKSEARIAVTDSSLADHLVPHCKPQPDAHEHSCAATQQCWSYLRVAFLAGRTCKATKTHDQQTKVRKGSPTERIDGGVESVVRAAGPQLHAGRAQGAIVALVLADLARAAGVRQARDRFNLAVLLPAQEVVRLADGLQTDHRTQQRDVRSSGTCNQRDGTSTLTAPELGAQSEPLGHLMHSTDPSSLR